MRDKRLGMMSGGIMSVPQWPACRQSEYLQGSVLSDTLLIGREPSRNHVLRILFRLSLTLTLESPTSQNVQVFDVIWDISPEPPFKGTHTQSAAQD